MDIIKDNIGIIGVFFVVIIGVGIFFLRAMSQQTVDK